MARWTEWKNKEYRELPVKERLVSKYDNKIAGKSLRYVLIFVSVSHSAQLDIIIKFVYSCHLVSRGDSEEEA
jgi:hypothetical protein